jgi:hypothetical protein
LNRQGIKKNFPKNTSTYERKRSAAVLGFPWALTEVEWIYEFTNLNVSAWPGQQFQKALYPDTANTMRGLPRNVQLILQKQNFLIQKFDSHNIRLNRRKRVKERKKERKSYTDNSV